LNFIKYIYEANSHPHSRWLETCPSKISLAGIGACFQGNVSAIGDLFMEPSPIEDPVFGEARVFHEDNIIRRIYSNVF